MMPPAFITYGWCRSSYAAIRSLSRRGVRVHVGDASPLAMGRFSRHAGSFSRLPDFFASPDDYVAAVVTAMERTGARVLLPCHEDVGVFCRRMDRLPRWIRSALPEPGAYDLVNDKRRVVEYAGRLGIPTPRSRAVAREDDLEAIASELGWPVVVKTHVGNSAKGVRIVRDAAGLRTAFRNLVSDFGLPQDRWPFIEEYLPGRACGACLLLDRGRVVASFAEEYLRCKGGGLFGTSTYRRSMPDAPGVLDPARRLLESVGWHGVAHCDFLAGADGGFRLIEVNPRLWGAVSLSVAAGVDFPGLWYDLAAGRPMPAVSPEASDRTRCRWILGDLFAAGTLAARGRPLQALRALRPVPGVAHDDWSWSDPLPFAFECMDYLGRSLRMGGTNPAGRGMIR